MSRWLTAAEANRRYYEERAAAYDESELCVVAEADRARLREHLAVAAKLNPSIKRALDAGGGTGNAGTVLLEMGIEPVVVDVSPEMLAQWEAKAARLGRPANTALADIGDFLSEDETEWDLIVFSSVLHHLEDPRAVLEKAAHRLAPNGVVVTLFDTIEAGRIGRVLRRADWILYALIHDRAAVSGALRARARARGGVSGEPHIGRLAERHALTGLDDIQLVDALRRNRLEIVRHERSYGAHYWLTRAGFRLFRRPSSFSLIARRVG